MSGLSVSENIKKIYEQMTLLQNELARLEGSLRVFKNLQELGIENIPIPVPASAVENNDVIDTSPN